MKFNGTACLKFVNYIHDEVQPRYTIINNHLEKEIQTARTNYSIIKTYQKQQGLRSYLLCFFTLREIERRRRNFEFQKSVLEHKMLTLRALADVLSSCPSEYELRPSEISYCEDIFKEREALQTVRAQYSELETRLGLNLKLDLG